MRPFYSLKINLYSHSLTSSIICKLEIMLRKNIPHFINKPENSIIHEILSSNPESRHLVSRFVHAFTTPICTKHLKIAWSTVVNDDVSDEIWEEGLSRIKSCSVNSR